MAMRGSCPNSTESVYSSIFDRYSQELNETHLSILSEDSLIGFDKAIKHLDSIQSIAPAIEATSTSNSASYSHYEPVNNILQFLHTKKITLQNLKQNNSDDPSLYDVKTTSFCQYWGINDENYQVIGMLEPGLIKTQTNLFQFYQFIKEINFELKIMSTHYIPEVINFKSEGLKESDKNKIFKSFHILSNLFSSLYLNLLHVMENKIVVNSGIVSTIINDEFEKMDGSSDSFTMGIVVMSELYENNDALREYIKSNSDNILKQNGLNKRVTNTHDILPHLLITKYKHKLNMFDSILPFELVGLQLSKAIDHCNNIKTKIRHEKSTYQRQIMMTQQREWLTSNGIKMMVNLPMIIANTFIFIPFVLVCWMIFSLKAACFPEKPKKHK